MTTLLDIKPYIYKYVTEHLSEDFTVYWSGEYIDEPNYPFCVLTTIAESKNYRTSVHNGKLSQTNDREKIYTRYKTCTITVSIYNGWTSDTTGDLAPDEQKEFAYQSIDKLEGAFEQYPINTKFSVQRISPIRPLHEPSSGGYMFRYEFDLTIGYDEPESANKPIGKQVETNVYSDSGEGINFKVTVDDKSILHEDLHTDKDNILSGLKYIVLDE